MSLFRQSSCSERSPFQALPPSRQALPPAAAKDYARALLSDARVAAAPAPGSGTPIAGRHAPGSVGVEDAACLPRRRRGCGDCNGVGDRRPIDAHTPPARQAGITPGRHLHDHHAFHSSSRHVVVTRRLSPYLSPFSQSCPAFPSSS